MANSPRVSVYRYRGLLRGVCGGFGASRTACVTQGKCDDLARAIENANSGASPQQPFTDQGLELPTHTGHPWPTIEQYQEGFDLLQNLPGTEGILANIPPEDELNCLLQTFELLPPSIQDAVLPGYDLADVQELISWLLMASAASDLGDLTVDELEQIQSVVDRAGRPLHVVGSAAQGTRRNRGTDLPLGKGDGTKSDIDYLVSPSSIQYFEQTGLLIELPSIDKEGLIEGLHMSSDGPAIYFEPGVSPIFKPEAS